MQNLRDERKNESGAIMLEIIAVLALMGVMGAMLFRQINHRNQELHNVQMASEIRIVKEAFSAWLQTNQARVTTTCPLDRNSPNIIKWCDDYTSEGLAASIVNYLPVGYFESGNSLQANYSFQLFGYWAGNGVTIVPSYYGSIVPKDNVLPEGGERGASWNFKRAARIAMLIGGDGGAYDPEITGSVIAGSVGTWNIDIYDNNHRAGIDVGNNNADMDVTKPRYVAITGLDVFQPEVEVPTADVEIPAEWTLVTSNLGAYGTLIAGAENKVGGCFQVQHNQADNHAVANDSITAPTEGSDACDPAFWVESKDNNQGDVFVRNALYIGKDIVSGKSAVSITGGHGQDATMTIYDENGKPGVVIKGTGVSGNNNTLTIASGKLMTNQTTGTVSASDTGYQYQVDPANTSVMYDIRLGSRGGMKLSDLLPKYSMQGMGTISCNETITAWTCPDRYTRAVLLSPHVTSTQVVSAATSRVEFPVNNDTGTRQLVVVPGGTAGTTDQKWLGVDTTVNTTITHPTITLSTGGDLSKDKIANGTPITVNCTNGQGQIAYQTYCVLDTIEQSDTKGDATKLDSTTCEEMGGQWSSGVCNATDNTNNGQCHNFNGKKEPCERAGCIWKNNTCSAVSQG